MKKHIKASLRAHKAVKKLRLDLLHAVHLNSDDDMLKDAKRLHAHVYRKINFVDDSEIIDDIIHEHADPHQLHAYYFGVYDKSTGSLLATARQIEHMTEKGYASFPVLEKASIYKKYLDEIYSVGPEKIVEISALVKSSGAGTDATLYLLKEMLDHSIAQGHRYWLMALDTNYNKSLKALFGDSYYQIGNIAHYKGGDIVPCLLEPETALKIIRTKSIRKTLKSLGAHKEIANFFAEVSVSCKENN